MTAPQPPHPSDPDRTHERCGYLNGPLARLICRNGHRLPHAP